MPTKRLFLSLLLVFLMSHLSEARRNSVGLDAQFGHNSTYGLFYGSALKASFELPSDFRLNAAVRQLSFPRTVIDLRPAYVFDLPFAELSLEALAQYAYQSSTDDICVGLGASLRRPYFWVDLGMYYRQFSPSRGGSVLREPFNLMYELGVSCFPYNERWDLLAIFTTKRMGALERFYSPSFVIEGSFSPSEKLSFVLSLENKSAGIFNIARTSYQTFANIGVRYIW